MSIRVAIADDQQLVRAGFRMILDTQPDIEVVGEATDGAEAVLVTERDASPTSCSWTSECPASTASKRRRRILRATRDAHSGGC